MGVRPTKAVRDERTRLLAPLFAQMRLQRMSNVYVAEKLGIPDKRLWAYQHGETRIPQDFIERACAVVGLAPSLIPVPEPRDIYLQQPPKRNGKKSGKQAGKRRASGGDGRRRRADDTPEASPEASGDGGDVSGDATPRRSRRAQQSPARPEASAFDMPPTPRSRRVARPPHGLTTAVATDPDVLGGNLGGNLTRDL
jgi:hypothetical protein